MDDLGNRKGNVRWSLDLGSSHCSTGFGVEPGRLRNFTGPYLVALGAATAKEGKTTIDHKDGDGIGRDVLLGKEAAVNGGQAPWTMRIARRSAYRYTFLFVSREGFLPLCVAFLCVCPSSLFLFSAIVATGVMWGGPDGKIRRRS